MCLAIPGKIVSLNPDPMHLEACLGTVEVTGVRRKVDLGLLKDDMPAVGEWVLIHVGFAMTKISEQDAMEQMHLLTMLGETEQAIAEVRGYGLDVIDDHVPARAGSSPYAVSDGFVFPKGLPPE